MPCLGAAGHSGVWGCEAASASADSTAAMCRDVSVCPVFSPLFPFLCLATLLRLDRGRGRVEPLYPSNSGTGPGPPRRTAYREQHPTHPYSSMCVLTDLSPAHWLPFQSHTYTCALTQEETDVR